METYEYLIFLHQKFGDFILYYSTKGNLSLRLDLTKGSLPFSILQSRKQIDIIFFRSNVTLGDDEIE